ncbi:hypothetical protein C8N35_10521 [Breoghania corrubedonensis]|uniref:Lipoprotein n=2 Tax=Breoghania corrubedonensis TaxID=665038 RepID=A0A2T5V8G6_9HYPH|nr:hypothetical protein C8N35_10521 [Breoghania corrubedonensis]
MIVRRKRAMTCALLLMFIPVFLASCGEGVKPYDIAQSEYLSLNPAQMTVFQAGVRDSIKAAAEIRFREIRAVVHPTNGYLIACGLVDGTTKSGHAVTGHLVYVSFQKDPSPWGATPKVKTVDNNFIAEIECPRLGLFAKPQ